jgi:uncharacterized protein YdhG (YjbR/CyaY superfamily)
MDSNRQNFSSVDDYIRSFPEPDQQILEKLRQIIKSAAPDADETISYQMPTFRLQGVLVHFAAFPHHIGFYPTPSGIEAFDHELAHYKKAKGSVQFPKDQPIPYDLVRRIVEYRVQQNLDRHTKKG